MANTWKGYLAILFEDMSCGIYKRLELENRSDSFPHNSTSLLRSGDVEHTIFWRFQGQNEKNVARPGRIARLGGIAFVACDPAKGVARINSLFRRRLEVTTHMFSFSSSQNSTALLCLHFLAPINVHADTSTHDQLDRIR
jgi:hypothetical protein